MSEIKTKCLGVVNDYFSQGFERNFYSTEHPIDGIILLGEPMDVESLWKDRDGKYYLHVNCYEFSGDIEVETLEIDNLIALANGLKRNMR